MSTNIQKKPQRVPNSKAILPKKCQEDSVLLTLLKKFNLQSYYKPLADKGFDHNLYSLVSLPERQLDPLLDSLNFFPGHRTKFLSVLALLKKLHISEQPRGRSSSQRSQSKEKTKRPGSCKSKISSASSFTKLLDFQDSHVGNNSETDRDHLAIELEEANKKIRELTLQIEKQIPSPQKYQEFDPFEELPEISRDRPELGVSYDSSKMRSTLHYLDIEEICKCLSKAIRKMILETGTSLETASSIISSSNDTKIRLPESIIGLFNSQFCDPSSKIGVFPCEDDIYNISKNIIIRSKMEKECSIICLIYIERLKAMTGICPTEKNWKRLLFFCLILASKIWDDESYENQNFADVFSNISLKELNQLEVTFLNLIDYKVGISKSEYAKSYFLLRTFADKKYRSFPIQPLDVDTVRRLQGNTNNAEAKLREIHQEDFYKTL